MKMTETRVFEDIKRMAEAMSKASDSLYSDLDAPFPATNTRAWTAPFLTKEHAEAGVLAVKLFGGAGGDDLTYAIKMVDDVEQEMQRLKAENASLKLKLEGVAYTLKDCRRDLSAALMRSSHLENIFTLLAESIAKGGDLPAYIAKLVAEKATAKDDE